MPILCFDGDDAGRRAAARAAARILPLLKPDHSARFAFLPDGQDPDSLVNSHGKKALESVVEAAMPLVDFLWQYHTAGQNFDTPEARAGLSKTLEQEVLRIPEREVQHYYRQAFREKVNKAFGQNYRNNNYKGAYSKKSYGNNFYGKKPYGKNPVNQAVTPMKRPSFSRQKLVEQVLLAAILNHPALFDAVEEDLGMISVQEVRLDQLRQAVLSSLSQEPESTAEVLQKQLADQGFSSEIKGLLSESVYTHARFTRPQSEIEDVQAGWRQALNALQQTHL